MPSHTPSAAAATATTTSPSSWRAAWAAAAAMPANASASTRNNAPRARRWPGPLLVLERLLALAFVLSVALALLLLEQLVLFGMSLFAVLLVGHGTIMPHGPPARAPDTIAYANRGA